MPPLPIRIYGDPVLRQKAKHLTREDVNAAFRDFTNLMGETMYAASGVGLASTQVGDLRRFFIADIAQVVDEDTKKRRSKNPQNRKLLVFINPEVLESSDEDDVYQEGCLSIPEIEADVYRPIRIKIRYRDLEWRENEEWVDGLLARVFQHELDHLDGVLFIDRVGEATRTKLAGALNRLKRKTEDNLNGH